MKRYANAVDLRRALEARLKQQAERDGADLGRLRWRALYDRGGARLAFAKPGRWVLKGGIALELRLLDARATKDLDLVLRSDPIASEHLRDELIETFAEDVDQDWFNFRVGPPTALDCDAAGHPAWRFPLQGNLAGNTFAGVQLDIVCRSEELAATEQLTLPGVLGFAGVCAHALEAVHRRQRRTSCFRDTGNPRDAGRHPRPANAVVDRLPEPGCWPDLGSSRS